MNAADALDEPILEALHPVATSVERDIRGFEEPGEVIVTWAVVVFEYLDSEGERQHAYRRVRANWFDVAGASKLLDTAHFNAWTVDFGEGEDS